ncbi:MAG: CocE/NonD family hydrolase, partial [Nocardioidaceae bacterium]
MTYNTMGVAMRRVLPLLAAALACLLTTTVLAGQAAGATGSSTGYRTIPGSGGTPLKAFVVTPNSPGKHPLLVMPSSWSMSDIEYLAQAWKLAEQSNYEVVSFTSRGFADSGGTIDIAGPKTVDDVSKVIDWALANTPADPDEIGVAGISYGAGLGLLSAANDPRIKAVAAMSGWSDLAASLYPGKTVSSQTVTALLALGNLTGRPGPKMRKLQQEYFSGDVKDAISDALKLAPARSAATKLDAINAHHPAVLMA